MKVKPTKLTLKNRLLLAAVLSIVYTNVIAFIIYGTVVYHPQHMLFDYVYSLVFFLALHQTYYWLQNQLETRLKAVTQVQRYTLGLLIFMSASMLLFTVIALVPFTLLLQPLGEIEFGMEVRLNYTINLLFSSVYYLCFTAFHILRNYHRAMINAEMLQKEIAQAQYEGLKNQINPHFLFNSLNVLSTLVHIDADLSEKFIDQLAKAYRYVLEQHDHELVVLKTEIDFINAYIFLLKIRFEDKLQVSMDIPAEKLNHYLPPLTLQLLIENAVKHNVLSRESPLVVNISVTEDDYLVVQNNLQIRTQEFASTGVGLKNITNRYEYITQRKVFFHILGKSYISKVPLLP
ncbi:histidine kinase [Adhaeribacter sp. BT258]|uniref:Histidine kinase n=1 Tax=Adhaeribacter terrigena TaxID=2793070 RepID=A0ABS1C061_9BACT|nr:histidine kinase [Adhaeribacter terrigena]MBK0402789.1 histidine kinase [Adhaeribacter terrigena]